MSASIRLLHIAHCCCYPSAHCNTHTALHTHTQRSPVQIFISLHTQIFIHMQCTFICALLSAKYSWYLMTCQCLTFFSIMTPLSIILLGRLDTKPSWLHFALKHYVLEVALSEMSKQLSLTTPLTSSWLPLMTVRSSQRRNAAWCQWLWKCGDGKPPTQLQHHQW